ncbi:MULTISPECIES: AAA family ATPase [Pseudomonas]|uniref:AAA family ATPase n=1 Tax=Pseudomonas monteilii TaxID=76759 RepID=A0A2N1IP09_9PSED|nr:AAA family ATPase [Pseudomonas monteilii]PKI19992.1 AAA family ATPase [Pseudomonas monteilii]RPD92551.1 ATP-binding protein [Pseudomonas monteilii]
MRNNISFIKAKLPHSEKVANIPLANKNLIITGVNGCGKTKFLESIFDYLVLRVRQKQNHSLTELQHILESNKVILQSITKADANYEHYSRTVESYERQVAVALDPPVGFSNLQKYVIDVEEQRAVLLKFEATRQANIRESKGAKSTAVLKQEVKSSDAALLFEEYLVSQKTLQAYAESPRMANNPTEAANIAAWFDKLEADLRELFEDDSLVLHFDYHAQSFFIRQNGKLDYRFQQLSSGFSSVLAIYAELLTKIQLGATSASDVYGVVIIDEIDAHLHVSLQRKILSFLVKSFPCIQFIVSTHSPFVVSSVSDALIYDLSTLECVDDLSMYSYESILSGLFKTSPVSEVLQEKILELGRLLESPSIDVAVIEQYVKDIGEHESVLDSESAFFLKKARIAVNKSKGGVKHV